MGRFEKPSSQKYTEELFAKESDLLKEIRLQLEQDNDWAMHISPMEGKILQLLIQMTQPKKVVEIGTLYGYSTLWMAEVLTEDAQIWAFEKMEPFYHKAQHYIDRSPHKKKIQLTLGDAKDHLHIVDTPIDMIFIDADKSHYLEYLDWAEKHLRPGGLIVGDNTFLFGHMYGEGGEVPKTTHRQKQNMSEFNLRLADPTRYTSVILPTPEGMTVAIKRSEDRLQQTKPPTETKDQSCKSAAQSASTDSAFTLFSPSKGFRSRS